MFNSKHTQKCLVVCICPFEPWVPVSGLPGKLLVDLERSPQQRHGLFKSARVDEHQRQIVQTGRHGGVLITISGLFNLERLPHQRFGFLKSVRVAQ